eukprot:Gb_06104 [translate_table: standard]
MVCAAHGFVCAAHGLVSEIGELRRWNITDHWDRRPDPAYCQLKQDLDSGDSYPTSSYFWELSCHQSWRQNGQKKDGAKQANSCVGWNYCNILKNKFRIQSCSQKKQPLLLGLSFPGLILGEHFQISRFHSYAKQCHCCWKMRVLSPQAISHSSSEEDGLLGTDLLEGCEDIELQNTVNLIESTDDEPGTSEGSVMKPAGNQIALVHKSQPEDCVGEVGRESHRKSIVSQDNNGRKELGNHVKSDNAQLLYEAILSAHNNEELQNMLSTMGVETNIKSCNAVLKLLEKENDDKTLNLFHWMRQNGKVKANLPAYNIAFRVLSRRQDWPEVERLLKEMRVDSCCELNCQIFNTLIYSCSKRGLVEWGTKWFHQMVDQGIQPTQATYGMMMSLYQKAGNLCEAECIFEHMKNTDTNCCGAYSAMITIYVRLGLYEKAEVVIDLMKKKQVAPNQENWLVQLNAYSQQGKLQEAEKVMQSMQESGIPPNIIAFNSLITGYGKMGLFECAVSLFHDLLHIGLKPDEATYRSMIEGCGRAGKLKQAMRYYDEMKTSGFCPSSLNFKTIINLQAKFKDEEGAMQILLDMREMGCEYASIIHILVQAYERADRLDKVPFIVEASHNGKGLLDETSRAILVLAYARHGMLAEALDLLQEVPESGIAFQEGLYHVLICTCKEAGNYKDAAQVFSKMPKARIDPNLQITCTMIDTYSTMGLFAEAEDLFLQLKASNTILDMVTFSVVVKMYLNADLPKEAAQVLEMMENQNGIKPDSCLFHYMLRVYHKCGMLDKAAEVYSRIVRARLKWDGAMYNCIINCCGQALPINQTSKIFEDMLRSGFVPNTITFNVMIDIYGKAGLLTKAHEVLRLAKKQGLSDTISYNTMIAAYGKWKDYLGMEATLQEMQRGGYAVSLEAYNSMLDTYGKSDQLKRFGDVLERMNRAGCHFDLITYNILINVYGKKGLVDELANLLIKLKEEGFKPNLWTYNTLIGAYGVVGMTDEAVRVVKEMQDVGIQPDRVTYVNLIAAFEKNDNFLEAARWSLWMKQAGMMTS